MPTLSTLPPQALDPPHFVHIFSICPCYFLPSLIFHLPLGLSLITFLLEFFSCCSANCICLTMSTIFCAIITRSFIDNILQQIKFQSNSQRKTMNWFFMQIIFNANLSPQSSSLVYHRIISPPKIYQTLKLKSIDNLVYKIREANPTRKSIELRSRVPFAHQNQ